MGTASCYEFKSVLFFVCCSSVESLRCCLEGKSFKKQKEILDFATNPSSRKHNLIAKYDWNYKERRRELRDR